MNHDAIGLAQILPCNAAQKRLNLLKRSKRPTAIQRWYIIHISRHVHTQSRLMQTSNWTKQELYLFLETLKNMNSQIAGISKSWNRLPNGSMMFPAILAPLLILGFDIIFPPKISRYLHLPIFFWAGGGVWGRVWAGGWVWESRTCGS